METQQLSRIQARRFSLHSTVFVLFLITGAMVARADGPVILQASEAAAHVGETVVVEGRVADVFTSKKGNTFLNFGARYPSQTFSAVIFVDRSSVFPNVHALDGRKVRVSGLIKIYQGKPQIILREASQLRAL